MLTLRANDRSMVNITPRLLSLLVLTIVLRTSYMECTLNQNTIIPSQYCKSIPPKKNDNKPTDVYISCQILDIDDIDEDKMEYRLVMYLVRIWRDSRLNLKHIVTNTSVLFPANLKNDIWRPQLAYDNTKSPELIGLTAPHITLKVLSDESLYHETRANFRVGCPMLLENYPLDVQTCSFYISLLHNNNQEVVLKWIADENSPYKEMADSVELRKLNLLQFEMKDVITYESTKYWLNGNFSVLVANFTFVRRLTGSLMVVYIPSIMVVTLSWVSFWIDVKASPARITLGVTSVLTIVTQIIQSRNFVPPVDYLKAIDLWLIVCAILVFASLLEYAASYQYIAREGQKVRTCIVAEAWIEPESNGNAPKQKGINGTSRKKEKCTTEKMPYMKSNPYDVASRYIFPLSFMVFNIVYWTYYMSKRTIS